MEGYRLSKNINIKSDTVVRNDFELNTVNGLKILQAKSLLKYQDFFTHAFSTRIGANTPKPYDAFNIGRHVNDERLLNDASDNRRKLCQALNLNYNNLTIPWQKHTDNIAIIDKKVDLEGCDAVATRTKDLPILLTFADCVPIIAFDPDLKLICGIHAGWAGTAQNILSKALAKMVNIGSKRESIIVAIGPAIGKCCYEVGQDTLTKLKNSCSDSFDFSLVLNTGLKENYVDLKALNLYQAIFFNVGVVSVTDYCTACNSDLFYSHRRSFGLTGRHGLIISL